MSYKTKELREKYKYFRSCSICEVIKKRCDFNPYQHRCKECEDKKLRKCWKCKEIKKECEFHKDPSKKLGITNICKICKGKQIRIKNETFYINKRKYDKSRSKKSQRKFRTFISGCLKRLKSGNKDASKLLGFTKEAFESKFPNISIGYSIDHCIPLSWFKKETPISISCSLHNLQLLPSLENSKKKNYFYHQPSDLEYFKNCLNYIDNKYLDSIKIPSTFGEEGGS